MLLKCRVMRPSIEVLEGRTLFAAGNGGAALLARAAAFASDPAVQATVDLIEADGVAIEGARQQIRTDSADSRAALRGTLRAGAELLAADRQAVRDAKDDPAALEAAKEKLKADRQQLRDDIAAAREQLRSDTTDGRAELREALRSLRAHLKQLRIDLRNAAGTASNQQQPQATGGTLRVLHSAPTGNSSSTSPPYELPSVPSGATLDLTNNDLIIDYTNNHSSRQP